LYVLLQASWVNLKGQTAIMFCAADGDASGCEQLCSTTPDLDLQDNEGWTAVMHAGAEGQIEALTILLEYGADANVQSLTGSTALMITLRGGNYECVEFLCSLTLVDLDLQDDNGNTAVHVATQGDDPELLQLLLENGALVNALNTNGFSPLASAAQLGLADEATLLLQAGADIDQRHPETNNTPMIWAAGMGGNLEVLKLLLENGANLQLKNHLHQTALQMAITNCNDAGVKLLEAGLPQFLQQPQSQQHLLGDKVRLEVQVQADPAPRFHWLYRPVQEKYWAEWSGEGQGGGERAAGDGGGKKGATISAYLEVVVEGEAEYICVAVNLMGTVKSHVAGVRLPSVPRVVGHPQGDMIRKGGKISIYCDVRGEPLPEIVWYKDGERLADEEGKLRKGFTQEMESLQDAEIEDLQRCTLELTELEYDDEGDYELHATNLAGETRSNSAHVIVLRKPTIELAKKKPGRLRDGTLVKAHTVEIALPVAAVPEAEFIWRRDGEVLTDEWEHVLGVDPEEEAVYTCVIKNHFGSTVVKGAEFPSPAALYSKCCGEEPEFFLQPKPLARVHIGEPVAFIARANTPKAEREKIKLEASESAAQLKLQGGEGAEAGEAGEGASEDGKESRGSEVPNSKQNRGMSQGMEFPDEMGGGAVEGVVDEYENPMIDEDDEAAKGGDGAKEEGKAGRGSEVPNSKQNRGMSQGMEFPDEMGRGEDEDEEVEQYSNPLHEEDEGGDDFLSQIRRSPKGGESEFKEWGGNEEEEEEEEEENPDDIWYQWYCNGDMLVGYNDSTLEIPDCQPWHAGQYVCCAHNGTGMAQSTSVMLEVLQMPVVQPRPMLSTALVELSVDVDAAPPPSFQWYCDGVSMAGETGPTCKVDPNTRGVYKCVATNDMGSCTLSSMNFPLREVPLEEPEGGWPEEEDDEWWAACDEHGEGANARGGDPRSLLEIITAKRKEIHDYRTRDIRSEFEEGDWIKEQRRCEEEMADLMEQMNKEFGIEGGDGDDTFDFSNPLHGGGQGDGSDEGDSEWHFPEYGGEIGWDVALDPKKRFSQLEGQLNALHEMDNPFFQRSQKARGDSVAGEEGFAGSVGMDVGLGEGARRRFSLEDKRLELMFTDNPMSRFRKAAKSTVGDEPDGGAAGGYAGRVSFSAGLDGFNSKRRYSSDFSSFFDNPMGTHRGNARRDQRQQLEQLSKSLKKGVPIGRGRQGKPLTRQERKELAEAEAAAEYAASLAETTAKLEAEETEEEKQQRLENKAKKEAVAQAQAKAVEEKVAKEQRAKEAERVKADASSRSKKAEEAHKHDMSTTFLKKSNSTDGRSATRKSAHAVSKKGRVAELMAKMQSLNEQQHKKNQKLFNHEDEQQRIKSEGLVATRRAKFEHLISGGTVASNTEKVAQGPKAEQQAKPKPSAQRVLRQSIQRHSMALQMEQATHQLRASARASTMGGTGVRNAAMSTAMSIMEGDEDEEEDEQENSVQPVVQLPPSDLNLVSKAGVSVPVPQTVGTSPIEISPITTVSRKEKRPTNDSKAGGGDEDGDNESQEFDEVRTLNPKSSWVRPSHRRSLRVRDVAGASASASARASARQSARASGVQGVAMPNGHASTMTAFAPVDTRHSSVAGSDRYFSDSSTEGSRSAASSRATSNSVNSASPAARNSVVSYKKVMELAPRKSTRLSTVNMFGQSIEMTIEHEALLAYEIEHTQLMPTVQEDEGDDGGEGSSGGSKWESKLESHDGEGSQSAAGNQSAMHGGHEYPVAPPFVQPVTKRTYSIVAGGRMSSPPITTDGPVRTSSMVSGDREGSSLFDLDASLAPLEAMGINTADDDIYAGTVLSTAKTMRSSAAILPRGSRHQKRTSFARRSGTGAGVRDSASTGARRSGFRNSLMPSLLPENSMLLPPPPLSKQQRMLGSTALGGFNYGGHDFDAERDRGDTTLSQGWSVFPEALPELNPNSSVFGHVPRADIGAYPDTAAQLNPMRSQHQLVNSNSAASRSTNRLHGESETNRSLLRGPTGGTIAFSFGDAPLAGLAPPQRVIKNAKAILEAKRAKGLIRQESEKSVDSYSGDTLSSAHPHLMQTNSLDGNAESARGSTKSSAGRSSTKSTAGMKRVSSRDSTKSGTSVTHSHRQTAAHGAHGSRMTALSTSSNSSVSPHLAHQESSTLPLLTYLPDHNKDLDLHHPHALETRDRCMTLAGVGHGHGHKHSPGLNHSHGSHGRRAERTLTSSNRDRTRTRGLSTRSPAMSTGGRSDAGDDDRARSKSRVPMRNPPLASNLSADSQRQTQASRLASQATAEFQRQHRGMSTAINASDNVILGKDEGRTRGMTNLMPFGGRGRGVSAAVWRTRAATTMQNAEEELGREGEDTDNWDGQNKMLASLGRHMFQGGHLGDESSHGDIRDQSRPRGMTSMHHESNEDVMMDAYGRTIPDTSTGGEEEGDRGGWKTHRVRGSGMPVMRDMRSITLAGTEADGFFEDTGKSSSIWSEYGDNGGGEGGGGGGMREAAPAGGQKGGKISKVCALEVNCAHMPYAHCFVNFLIRSETSGEPTKTRTKNRSNCAA
jgi:ankyrin repeat protein